MQTHLAARALKSDHEIDKDVTALFAVEPNRKAVLFIHGFSGDAVNTWSHFPQMIPATRSFAGHDLFFYGFDGLWADMISSAAMFRSFLDRMFKNVSKMSNENLPLLVQRAPVFDYDELIIVAHSLGAVVARRALLDATTQQKPWVIRTKLVLYAPAHNGAPAAELALEAAANIPFLGKFISAGKFVSPLIRQLQADSTEIKELLADTLKARENKANPHLRAYRVFIAQYEKIIGNCRFADDPPPDAIPGTNHISICKPRIDFRAPLERLEECI
jgi:pimeloyl-ACP methyl ester carboxylesterase